ncbi:MAG: 50S ribosomal protein L5, partial [Patescibacteria group bacterium]
MVKKQDKNLKNKLDKVVVNSGIGRFSSQSNFEEKFLPELMKELATITGQKPAPRGAKQSIAGFKTRQGNIVGLKVTLRGKRMMEFLNKLNSIVLPRLRDFRGLDLKTVDAGGNLSIGLREQFVFPEILPENSKVNFGIQITIVPKTKKREEAVELYRELGVPLKKSQITNTK